MGQGRSQSQAEQETFAVGNDGSVRAEGPRLPSQAKSIAGTTPKRAIWRSPWPIRNRRSHERESQAHPGKGAHAAEGASG